MVQKPSCRRANCAIGRLKQNILILIFLVLDVQVRNLLPSMAGFVPCDRHLQRAHSVSIRFKVSTIATRSTDDRSTALMELTSARKQTIIIIIIINNNNKEYCYGAQLQ